MTTGLGRTLDLSRRRWWSWLGVTAPFFFTVRIAATAGAVLLLATAPFLPPASAGVAPQRIVSINLCTDQLALLMAPRSTILSVSYLAARPDISFWSDKATGIFLNHGRSEEILPLAPDIVLAGRYTSRPTVFLLQRLGYDVLDQDISRSIAEVRQRVLQVGQALAEEDEAQALIEAMDRRLAALVLAAGARRPTAVYYQANGYTAGDDTLVGDIIGHAGLENLGGRLGLRGHGSMPLETLLELKPDILIRDDQQPEMPVLAYEVLRHPALKALIDRSLQVVVPRRLWICGIPAVVEAVAILSEARRRLTERTRS